MMSSRTSPAATRCAIGRCRPSSTCSMNHARTRPSCTTPSSRVAAACAATSPSCLRQLHRAAERLVGAVEVDLLRGRGERLAGGGAQEVLAELHARGELAFAVPALHGQVPHLARELRGAIVLLGGPHRRGPAQPHVDLQTRVAQRLGQRRELGEALHPVRRAPQHVERLVARVQEPDALLRGGGRRQRELDDAQDLLGRVGGERVPARLDREPDAHRARPRPPSRGGRSAAGLRPRARPTSAARRSPRGSPVARPT